MMTEQAAGGGPKPAAARSHKPLPDGHGRKSESDDRHGAATAATRLDERQTAGAPGLSGAKRITRLSMRGAGFGGQWLSAVSVVDLEQEPHADQDVAGFRRVPVAKR